MIGRTLAGLALAVASLGAAASPPALTAAEVSAFVAEFDAAERAGDADTIGAALAPDCRIDMHTSSEGHDHDTALSHDEFLADLGEYYASLHELSGYEYRSEPARVEISADGSVASALREVLETFTVDGTRHAFHIEETTRIERRDGRLVITALASRSRPD